MSTIFYRQCRLRRETSEQVSYLPQKFAVTGRILRLKRDDGQWEDGWQVMSHGEDVPEELLPDPHQAVKLHRRATGDSATRPK